MYSNITILHLVDNLIFNDLVALDLVLFFEPTECFDLSKVSFVAATLFVRRLVDESFLFVS